MRTEEEAKESLRLSRKKYDAVPDNREKKAIYRNSKEYKQMHLEYNQRLEQKEKRKLWKAANKDSLKAYQKEYRKTLAGKLSTAISKVKYYQRYPEKAALFSSRSYVSRVLKPMVLIRDSFTCQLCETNDKLIIHHIIPVSQDPILITDVNNLITLCKACHLIAHANVWSYLDQELAEQFKGYINRTLPV